MQTLTQPPACITAPPSAPQARPCLDTVLIEQPYVQELLLPTPANLNAIHVPGSDLLQFLRVQQWVATNLRMKLPLLNGMFVLVPSCALHKQQCGFISSGADSSKVAAAIPWCLRQVSGVELAPSGDPADATVVLVGGDRVHARAVREGLLTDMEDHQYLCCEVAALQQASRLRQLRVFDIAHMGWRLQTACDMEVAINIHKQEQAQMLAAGCEPGLIAEAGRADLDWVMSLIRKLPPPTWTTEHVLPFIELNRYQYPEVPDQPWTLLSVGQYNQLLQTAAVAWQHYVQCKLAGQQPQPVVQLVPWQPLPGDEQSCMAVPAGAAAAAADTAGCVSTGVLTAAGVGGRQQQQPLAGYEQPCMAVPAAAAAGTAGMVSTDVLVAAGVGAQQQQQQQQQQQPKHGSKQPCLKASVITSALIAAGNDGQQQQQQQQQQIHLPPQLTNHPQQTATSQSAAGLYQQQPHAASTGQEPSQPLQQQQQQRRQCLPPLQHLLPPSPCQGPQSPPPPLQQQRQCSAPLQQPHLPSTGQGPQSPPLQQHQQQQQRLPHQHQYQPQSPSKQQQQQQQRSPHQQQQQPQSLPLQQQQQQMPPHQQQQQPQPSPQQSQTLIRELSQMSSTGHHSELLDAQHRQQLVPQQSLQHLQSVDSVQTGVLLASAAAATDCANSMIAGDGDAAADVQQQQQQQCWQPLRKQVQQQKQDTCKLATSGSSQNKHQQQQQRWLQPLSMQGQQKQLDQQ